MNLQDQIAQAVQDVVAESEQPNEVAEEILDWLSRAPDPSRSDDEQDSFRRLEKLFGRLVVPKIDDEEEE
jgi:hypothetical protein